MLDVKKKHWKGEIDFNFVLGVVVHLKLFEVKKHLFFREFQFGRAL